MTIMLDVPIGTDQTILVKHPNIMLHNKQERTCLLFYIGIPEDTKLILEKTETLSKYKDVEIKISRMWNAKTRTALVMVGAVGILKKRI